jgi:hypothetical protein
MRIKNKFKFYFTEKRFILSCPKKIKKFKRSKWFSYDSIIKKNIKRNFFLNPILLSQKKNIKKGVDWEKKKLFFKKKLKLRRLFFHIYDNALTKKDFKQVYYMVPGIKSNPILFFKNLIIKFEFIAYIFLFKLNFFSSVYESKNAIKNKRVLLNNKPFSPCLFIKAGDIISFPDCVFANIKKIMLNQFKKSIFRSYVEVDYYTNTIIVVKDFKNLSIEDLTLFYVEHTNISKLRLVFKKS